MAHTVTVRLHHNEINLLLLNRARSVGNKVQRVAQRRAPVKTGRLATSIHVVAAMVPGIAAFADIGTFLRYGYWQHEGTGIYGPTGQPIRPKRASVMVFRTGRGVGPLGGGGKFERGHPNSGVVFARSVKGIQPLPFLTSSLISVVGTSARIKQFGGRRRTRRGRY